MDPHRFCVIMAGGVGSRFWPLSREHKPKQFLDILHTGRTFLQMTYDRLLPLVQPQNFVVATTRDYVPLVREQLPDVPPQNILAEPIRRNTAPCIAYAAYWIHKRDPAAAMVVASSDHYIADTARFVEVIRVAFEHVEEHREALVTLGMAPTRPETGYGYIRHSANAQGVVPVECFVEKPTLSKAVEYLAAGCYSWNAGIFVWTAAGIVAELTAHAPGVAMPFAAAAAKFGTAEEGSAVETAFRESEAISVDYAVMERSQHVAVVRCEIGWSDVGTWGSLYALGEKDASGNVGRAEMRDCTGCVVYSSPGKTVVVEGLAEFIVADTPDALLVCPKASEQAIRDIVAGLKAANQACV